MMTNIGSQADPAVTDATAGATVTAALKGLLSLAAAGSGLATKPPWAVAETGAATLIGADDQVDQNEYSASLGENLGSTLSGEILGILLTTSEAGTGSILTPAGRLLVFDADPAISAGDTAISAAEWRSLVGIVAVAAADWVSDSNGAAVYKNEAIAFHAASALYFAWFHEDAASFNDAAGDNEAMAINVWYRRDS